jgi:arylformamidase
MVRFIELSHPIEDGMSVFPGLPEPRIDALMDHDASRSHYEGKAEFYFGKVDMVANVGTYLDSPFHRYRDREDLCDLPLDKLAALPGVTLIARVGSDRSVRVDCDEADLRGRAVLLRTGWDQRWGTPAYWEPGPYVHESVVDLLIRAGAALVGVDFWNADDIEDPVRPVHTRLLGEGILIVEHLCNLAQLPDTGYRFYAVPPRIVRGASFPVRAFAQIDD